jgi:hypothetical protein
MVINSFLSILAEDDANLEMIHDAGQLSASDGEFDSELQMMEKHQIEKSLSSDSDFNERMTLLELDGNEELAYEIELERELLEDLSDFSLDHLEIGDEYRDSPSSEEGGSSSCDLDDPSATNSNQTNDFENDDGGDSFDDSDGGDSSSDNEDEFFVTKNDHVLFI